MDGWIIAVVIIVGLVTLTEDKALTLDNAMYNINSKNIFSGSEINASK